MVASAVAALQGLVWLCNPAKQMFVLEATMSSLISSARDHRMRPVVSYIQTSLIGHAPLKTYSNQYATIVNGRARASSPSTKTMPSIIDSMNSTAPLLRTDKALPTQPVSRGPITTLTAPQPQITRKQRRVKDPYAIDSDDEDDFAMPGGRNNLPSIGATENLQDFLRTTGPPVANGHAARPNGTRNGPPNGSASQPLNSRAPMNGNNARGRSNTADSSNDTPAPAVQPASLSNRPSAPTVGVAMKKFQARPAGATRAGFGGRGYHYSTNDMADFLRSSGPTALNGDRAEATPSPDLTLSKKGSFRGKKFWQRRTEADYN
jgi:hypothetical protein